MRKNPIDVMLSAAKHLAFSVNCEDEILRLSPQDDITTQSLDGEDVNSVMPVVGAGKGTGNFFEDKKVASPRLQSNGELY